MTNSPHPSSLSHFTETIASSKGFTKVPSPGIRDEYSLKRFRVCEQTTFASTDIFPKKTARGLAHDLENCTWKPTEKSNHCRVSLLILKRYPRILHFSAKDPSANFRCGCCDSSYNCGGVF